MLQPKRMKHRKMMKRTHGGLGGVALRGNTIAFGEFAIRTLEPAWLTARQIVRVAVGASLAYEVWDVSSPFPSGLRLALTACLVVSGLLLALLRPGGRPLDQWVLAFMVFVVIPRRRVWRASTPSAASMAPKPPSRSSLARRCSWARASAPLAMSRRRRSWTTICTI